MSTYTADIQISLTDLYSITGSNVDVNALQGMTPQAVSLIETVSGVFFEAAYREYPISVSDAAWLKKASIYQVQFMLENSDLLTRPAVSSLSQDGVSVSAPDGLTFVLAPLAKRALGNCSWAKSGTLRVAPAIVEKTDASFLTSDAHDWAPLGSA
jgi:hypothetical protein